MNIGACGPGAHIELRTPLPQTNPTTDAKWRLRTKAKATRAKAFAQHGTTASNSIAAHGIGFAHDGSPVVISGFLPIGEEIDPTPLLERLEKEGHRLALPVMKAKGKPLIFRAWTPGDPLDEVKWGIREPRETAPTVEPDIVLGPLLAFDNRGYRLGYGGGFYDRTLARLRALKHVLSIGLAYDEQRVDAVPHSSYDERLDWVLTPTGPIRCGIP